MGANLRLLAQECSKIEELNGDGRASDVTIGILVDDDGKRTFIGTFWLVFMPSFAHFE